MMEEELIKLTNALYKVTGLFPVHEPLKFAIRKEALDVLSFSILSGKNISSLGTKEDLLGKSLINLNLLQTYFDIAKEQKWVDVRNFSVLEKEYNDMEEILRSELFKTISEKKVGSPKTKSSEATAVKNETPVSTEKQTAVFQKEIAGMPKSRESMISVAGDNAVRSENNSSISDPVPVKVSSKKQEKNTTDIDYENLTGTQLKVLEILQSKGVLKSNEISKNFPDLTPRSVRRELHGLKEKRVIESFGSGRAVSYGINQVF
jgi:hypothetical protein